MEPIGPALRRLFGDSMVYGIGRVAGYLVGLVLLPVYTHYLSVEDYGLLENLFVLAMLLGTVVPLGLPDAAGRFWFRAEDEDERRAWLGTAFGGLSLSLLACVPLLLLAAGPIGRHLLGEEHTIPAVRLAAATLVPACLLSLALTQIRSRFRPWAFGLCSVLQVLLVGALNTWFVAGARMGITGVFLGGGLATTAVAAIALFLVRGDLRPRLSLSRLRPLLSYGLPLVPAFAATWALHYADRWLLLDLAGPAEVGLYSAGTRIAGVMLFLSFAFSTAFLPLAMEIGKRPEAGRVFARALTLYAAAAGALAILLTALARPALALLAPDAYADGAAAVPWLVPGFLLAGTAPALRIGLHLGNATRHVLWIDLLAAAVNVGLNLLLIPPYGMEGAAAATAGAFALLALLSFLAGRRHLPLPIEWGRLALVGVGTTAGVLLFA